jgi:hypothetical protein
MNKEDQERYFIELNIRKIKGIENLSDYPTKESTLEKLKDEIKPENIVEATKNFFKVEEENTT